MRRSGDIRSALALLTVVALPLQAAGIVFIGPSADSMKKMGSKAGAKELMASHDVPVVPGYTGADQDSALLAREAQRIGLQVIRDTVGDDVILDKDGSPMLNPVGIVDTGRVSADTGHTFLRSKTAAPGLTRSAVIR